MVVVVALIVMMVLVVMKVETWMQGAMLVLLVLFELRYITLRDLDHFFLRFRSEVVVITSHITPCTWSGPNPSTSLPQLV